MEKLRRLRTERGLSQARLAARAELDPSTVNQIERGARDASPATLRKLADALEVGLIELLEDAPPKAQAPLWPESEDAAGDSDGWLESYIEVGRHLLQAWRQEDESWNRYLRVVVDPLNEERRLEAPFSSHLLLGYLGWAGNTSRVLQAYIEGVLGKGVAGRHAGVDEVCDGMLRLWRKIDARSRGLSLFATKEAAPEIAEFRRELEGAQDVPDLEERFREAVQERR